jgi:CubicO group peptidase (beta-lactamase class C family)
MAALVAASLLATPASASEPLPRHNPARHDVSPGALNAALAAAEQQGFIRSMVVVRDGAVIGEGHWYGAPGTLQQSRSVTKSVMSMLIGIAIDRGDFPHGITSRMVDYLPTHLVPTDPAKQDILLAHLLTMTAGFAWNEDLDVESWLNGPDPVAEILGRPMAAPPGTSWNYNTAAAHLLSVMLTEATGMSTLDFADAYLFGPLGITERNWMTTGGYANGGHGLFVTTEDLAKLGLVFVNGGSWNGEQLVSRYWVNASTSKVVLNLGVFQPLTELHYGFLWWLDRSTPYQVYTAWGWGGQFIFCVPGLQLVIAVHTDSGVSGAVADSQEAAVLDLIVNSILPAATDRRVLRVTGQYVPELAAVDAVMGDVLREHDIRNATTAIVKDGRLVYARGFSWGEPKDDPVEPTALFRSGSIAKAITSVAIHQLLERGLLDYTTPARSIVDVEPMPEHGTDPRLDDVTVDPLLTHTGGLYSEDNVYVVGDLVADATGAGSPPTTSEILSYTVSHPFIFDPGTHWDYNNYGYMWLGEIIRELSGQSFADYVLDHIFRPIGVGRPRPGHMLPSELAPTEVDYDPIEGDGYRVPLENALPAGGWAIAAPDLARLFSALFDFDDASGLLSPATRAQMAELPFPACEAIGYGRGWMDESMYVSDGHSMGWLIDLDDGLDVRSHGGGGTGVHTLALWRSDGITFVMLTNKDPVAEDVDFPRIDSWPDHDLWAAVGVSAEPVGAAPTEVWIPVVSHASGVGGSVWRSDVGLLNRSTLANRVRLRLPTGDTFVDEELVLAPGEYRTLADVLSRFDVTGSRPLRVFSSEPLTTTSRTYNLAVDGTFGQFLDSLEPTRGLQSGDEAVLMQLAENGGFRSNIGLHNGWKRPAEVAITLLDGSSLPVASFVTTVPPESTVQLNRPFWREGGRADIDSGYAVVSVLTGQHVVAYGSVVDNLTDDPTTIAMKADPGFADQWLAAAANADGAHGSTWRTDLSLLNRSGQIATAEVRYRSDDSRTANDIVVLERGEQRTLVDVVGALGLTGGGSLQVVSDQPVLASSRTYNTGEDGTYGQLIDAVPVDSSASVGDTVWLPQLRQNGAFRTNIGVLNSSHLTARIHIRLFDGDGTELAAPRRTLAPMERIQLQEPLSRIAGRDDIDGGYATVTVESGGGIIVYASVVDNATNDPTTVPMKF